MLLQFGGLGAWTGGLLFHHKIQKWYFKVTWLLGTLSPYTHSTLYGGKDGRKINFDKIWERHVVTGEQGQPQLMYVDQHYIHEVTSPQAFQGLRDAGRKVRRPDLTFGTFDHNVPNCQYLRYFEM